MKSISLYTSFALAVYSGLSICDQAPEQHHVRETTLPATDSNVPIKNRVAVIGAGAGGSSTAYHISKFANGEDDLDDTFEIDVFESNPYVGGRTTTTNAFDDPRYPVEVGGSIFVKVNHILYNLSREFTLPHRQRLSESTDAKYDLGIWDGSSFVFTIANDDDDDAGTWKRWWKGYLDVAKLIWKYGLSPVWTQRAKNDAVSKFLGWYDKHFPIASLTNFIDHVGLSEFTGIVGEQFLAGKGVSEQFSREIIQSSTRVNYAQNLEGIHGLGTMICMAIEGAMVVEGGNWQIFDEALKRSGAHVYLNTTVTHVSQTDEGRYRLTTKSTSTDSINVNDNPYAVSREYDTIVLASPYQFANISFDPPILSQFKPKEIEYVTLHVTLFASPYRPSPSFFGLQSQDDVPDSILTTLKTSDLSRPNKGHAHNRAARGKDAVGPTKFWSLSTLRVIDTKTDEFDLNGKSDDEAIVAASKRLTEHESSRGRQYLYKIFSPEPVTASFLREIFGWDSPSSPQHKSDDADVNVNVDVNDDPGKAQIVMNNNDDDDIPNSNDKQESKLVDDLSALPRHQVSWHHTKEWKSYPYLEPRVDFDRILLSHPLDPTYPASFSSDRGRVSARPDPRNARGVWYTSGVEGFVSTMETSALMGMNVARILVDSRVVVDENDNDNDKSD